jgi:hypothetical protein
MVLNTVYEANHLDRTYVQIPGAVKSQLLDKTYSSLRVRDDMTFLLLICS